MSSESLQLFRTQVNGNAQQEAAVRACLTAPDGGLDIDALAALGRQGGFDFNADDVRAAMAATDDELSDFELEVVAGGAPTNANFNNSNV